MAEIASPKEPGELARRRILYTGGMQVRGAPSAAPVVAVTLRAMLAKEFFSGRDGVSLTLVWISPIACRSGSASNRRENAAGVAVLVGRSNGRE